MGLLQAINVHCVKNISTQLCSWVIDLVIHGYLELHSVRQTLKQNQGHYLDYYLQGLLWRFQIFILFLMKK